MISLNFTLSFISLVTILILVGTAACLPLYKGSVKKLIASSLFTKIIWWLPIFAILLIVLYGGFIAALAVTLWIIFLAGKEVVANRAYLSRISLVYVSLFAFFTLHLSGWFVLLPSSAPLLAAICVTSVLSDVIAFFMGSYLGNHKLPRWINNHKSWEGVIGQLLGAVVGALFVWAFLDISLSVTMVIFIGVASAFGDIINSIAKRSLGIKDWGDTIPGHGGVLDRMSSLSVALAVSLWLVVY